MIECFTSYKITRTGEGGYIMILATGNTWIFIQGEYSGEMQKSLNSVEHFIASNLTMYA